jgi:hypothetical protein
MPGIVAGAVTSSQRGPAGGIPDAILKFLSFKGLGMRPAVPRAIGGQLVGYGRQGIP